MTDIAVVVLSNRKQLYLPAAIESLKNVTGHSSVTIFDDSGDAEWAAEAGAIQIADEPVGYTRAMQRIWEFGRKHDGPILFLEEDFTIDEALDLRDLQSLLAADRRLMQVALQRQAWYECEHDHGGLVAALEAAPQWQGRVRRHERHVEQDIVFTTNPCLIPARAFAHDWPTKPRSEQAFSRILARKGFKFAYWGEAGHVTCTHHGSVTAGGGY